MRMVMKCRNAMRVKKEQKVSGVSKAEGDSKWKLQFELAWLSKAFEPALQLCRWALPTGNADEYIPPPSNRTSVIEKGDWRRVVDLVTYAKLVVSSALDVARKLAQNSEQTKRSSTISPPRLRHPSPMELLVPGSVYYLRREIADDAGSINIIKGNKSFTLWKPQPGDHFQRIVLSSNLISDHKCDSHYYALRDTIKSSPASTEEVLLAL